MITKSRVFDPLTTSTSFDVLSKDEYCAKQYCSVSTRLLFEYKLCLASKGLCYFVTFTYNESSIVKIAGRNLFFNSDIRYLFNRSSFRRSVKSHGYTFKYAVFGELGDGKGVRGKYNNPHYHSLIFLYPADDCDFYYHNESNFLSLCSDSWNECTDSLDITYSLLRRGNVSYSNKGALVLDESCFTYCSSYCIKSLSDVDYLSSLRSLCEKVSFFTLFNCLRPVNSCYCLGSGFTLSLLKKFVNTRCKSLSILIGFNSKTSDYLDFVKDALSYYYSVNCLDFFLDHDFTCNYTSDICDNSLLDSPIYRILVTCPLFRSFSTFLYNLFRPCYRLSSCLGINGLDYITEDFRLDVSSFHSFKSSSINLPSYYFRKRFFEPLRLDDGSYVYVRNSDYVLYVRKQYSLSAYHSYISSFNTNKYGFRSTLPDDLKLEFDSIPDNVFCAYKAFRSLMFNINDVPVISNRFPWLYLHNLDYSFKDVYCIPYDSSRFLSDGYITFNMHPYFVSYKSLPLLFSMYSKYIKSDSCSIKVSDVISYFDLSFEKFYITHEC